MAKQRKRNTKTNFRPPRLEFDVWEYNPQGLRKYDEKILRKEYRRLRDIAQKRLKRLGATEFVESEAYRLNRDAFAETRNIKNLSDLRRGLTQLARFVMAEGSTITGQKSIRARGIEEWRSKGYEFINESNWFAWVRFLEYVKSHEQFIYDLETMKQEFIVEMAENPHISAEEIFQAYGREIDKLWE